MPEEGKPAAFGVPVEKHLQQTFKVNFFFYENFVLKFFIGELYMEIANKKDNRQL